MRWSSGVKGVLRSVSKTSHAPPAPENKAMLRVSCAGAAAYKGNALERRIDCNG